MIFSNVYSRRYFALGAVASLFATVGAQAGVPSVSPRHAPAEKVVDLAGFQYDYQKQIYVAKTDALQRHFGFNRGYDYMAGAIGMTIDAEPIKFNFNGNWYMIELWKGQYYASAGAEIGLYYQSEKMPGHWECAKDSQKLQISYDLKKGSEVVFSMNDKNWWVGGFKPGYFAPPNELSLENIAIEFNEPGMGYAFYNALLSYFSPSAQTEYQVNFISPNTVTFRWAVPKKKQDHMRSRDKTLLLNRVQATVLNTVMGGDSSPANVDRKLGLLKAALGTALGRSGDRFGLQDILGFGQGGRPYLPSEAPQPWAGGPGSSYPPSAVPPAWAGGPQPKPSFPGGAVVPQPSQPVAYQPPEPEYGPYGAYQPLPPPAVSRPQAPSSGGYQPVPPPGAYQPLPPPAGGYRPLPPPGAYQPLPPAGGYQPLPPPAVYEPAEPIPAPGTESKNGCPRGYVFVKGDSTNFHTNDFCVAKYDMKNPLDYSGTARVRAIPVSKPDAKPWTNISYEEAVNACRSQPRVTIGHRNFYFDMISNAEWETIAVDLSLQGLNWSGGQVGVGDLNRGHTDNNPPTSLEAPPSDVSGNGSYGVVSRAHDQYRKHQLSTGENIWDFGGNVWKYVLDTTESLGVLPGEVPSMPIARITSGSKYDYLFGAVDDIKHLPFMGYLFNREFTGANKYILRGGTYDSIQFADSYPYTGIFTTGLFATGTPSDHVGFRCVARFN